jgi:GNAT superfamily N-acetyltransferase
LIREFRPDDAAAAAALYPEYEVMSEQRLLHKLSTRPPRAQLKAWLDESGGFAFAEFDWASKDSDLGYVVAHHAVDALYDVAEAHLVERGATRMRSMGGDLERRGYEPEHVEIFSALEPFRVDAPAGARTLVEFAGRERELYELSLACGDLPGGKPESSFSYDEWVSEALGDPTLTWDGSFVLEVDDVPSAYAWLVLDRERGLAHNEMTGTRPEFRGRGLALGVKLATVRWAAENGVSRIYTSNHEDNEPMRAVNRKLGYRVVAELVDYEREIAVTEP